MPEQPAIRDTLENEPISGVGGYLEFKQLGKTGETFPPEQLHVAQWELWHEIINARLPESGNFGSITYNRVADTFRFAAALDMDVLPARVYEPGPNVHQPHVDGRMEGAKDVFGSPIGFSIQVKFYCGDPTFWTHPEMQSIARPEFTLPGVFYKCNSVLLDRVYVLNSARGDDVVRCIVEGHGASPLRRYVGYTWCGAGALGMEEKDLQDNRGLMSELIGK